MIEDKVKKYYGVCGCGGRKSCWNIHVNYYFYHPISHRSHFDKNGRIGRTIGLYFLIVLITMLISKIYALLQS